MTLSPKGPPASPANEREKFPAHAPQREIVFLPALVTDSRLWVQQMEGLADIARPTVGDLTRHDSIHALAHDVLQLAPPGGFVLAGLSMGGYVALEIMRQAPQRVLALALVDTSARPDTPEASANRHRLMEQAGSDYKGVMDELAAKLLHPSRAGDAVTCEMFHAMAEGLGVEVFRRQQTAIMGRPDSRPHLADIDCPTLVMCGREDQVTPLEVHEEMHAGIRGAELKVIPDCGHLSALEQPLAVTEALRGWLLNVLRC